MERFFERWKTSCILIPMRILSSPMKILEKFCKAAFSLRRTSFASLFYALIITLGGGGILLIEPALVPTTAEARFGRGGSFGFRGSRSFSGSSFSRSRSFGRSAYSRGNWGGGFGIPFLMGFGFGGFGGSFFIPMILFFVLRMMVRHR